MKVSLDWIKDYVQLPKDMDLKKLAFDLTMSTVEVEDTVMLADSFDKMVLGVINELLPHPDANKLSICKTDIGGEEKIIVCGGTNLYAGMKVAVALPGAKVRWHGEGGLVEIGCAKLRGVESFGMICASSEIGLFDLFPFTKEATVMDLSDFDAPAGTPLAQALGLDDVILEIDNKSMTNRPDLWGHYGIAREISALFGYPLKKLEPFCPKASDSGFTVEIDDAERCPRYIGAELEGLSVKPSPYKMQSRIWRVGMRPINAIVDITNYVMLSTGQPTHAFDADNIKGHITVRKAKEGEKLLLLNDKELELTGDDLVIADSQTPVGLAGVMGGAKDSVLPTTNRVILEIANFDAMSIRRTATRYETRTEAATRYEKAIDPERCDAALSMAMELFAELYPEFKVTGFADKYPKPLKRSEIDVSLDWLEKRLGKRLTAQEIQNKLEALGFAVSFSGDNMHVTAPTWRSTGDVAIKADIMEEVARMYGYENFLPSPITTSFDAAINQIDVDIERKIKEYLAFRCGMVEIFSYPWMESAYVKAVLQSTQGMLALSTPPAPDEKYLRASLLPNLCKAVAGNLRYYNEFAIFETAQLLKDTDYTTPYDKREALPSMRRCVSGAFVASAENYGEVFRKAKGVLETMPRYAHMEALSFRQAEKPIWADSVVWLNIFLGEQQVGNLAMLSKKAALDCGIDSSAVMLFELDIDALKPFPSRTNKFEHLPQFPLTNYDVSVLLDANVKWAEIEDAAWGKKENAGFLRGVSFVDEYKGKQVPAGKKSVTIRLLIGSPDKTLTSGEIESSANTVLHRLEKQIGAILRKAV